MYNIPTYNFIRIINLKKPRPIYLILIFNYIARLNIIIHNVIILIRSSKIGTKIPNSKLLYSLECTIIFYKQFIYRLTHYIHTYL